MGDIAITPQLMAFGAIAGLAALAAVGVIASNNAIRSALCLVLNFFLLAVLYFTLNAQFLGVIQIVVYTGAIMVLFLFVIMLLNLGALDKRPDSLDKQGVLDLLSSKGPIGAFFILLKKYFKEIVGGILGFGLFMTVLAQVFLPFNPVDAPRAADDFGKPENLGTVLFTGYVWPFELASFLLLIGIVGSILLAKRRMVPTPIAKRTISAEIQGGEAE